MSLWSLVHFQIPSTWRSLLEEAATVQLFFDYYGATKPPLSNQVNNLFIFSSSSFCFFSSSSSSSSSSPALNWCLALSMCSRVSECVDQTIELLENLAAGIGVFSPFGIGSEVSLRGGGGALEIPLSSHERNKGNTAVAKR